MVNLLPAALCLYLSICLAFLIATVEKITESEQFWADLKDKPFHCIKALLVVFPIVPYFYWKVEVEKEDD